MIIPKCVRAVAEFAAHEAGKYCINTVHLLRMDSGRCRAEATDKRRLIRVDWEDAETRAAYPACGVNTEPRPGFEALISRKPFRRVMKRAPSGKARPAAVALQEQVLGETCRAGIDDGCIQTEIMVPVAGGSFPRIDPMLAPPAEGYTEIGMDAALLGHTLTTIAEVLGRKSMPGVVLRVPKSGNGPIVIEGPSAEAAGLHVIALQMPKALDWAPLPVRPEEQDEEEGDERG